MKTTAKPTPKPLIWVGDSLELVRTFPEAVKDELGVALYQAQLGGKHVRAKPLREHWLRSLGGRLRSSWRHLSRSLCGEAGRPGVRASRLPEEIEDRDSDAEIRNRPDKAAAQASHRDPCGMGETTWLNAIMWRAAAMSLPIWDLRDADEMLARADLAIKIADILRQRRFDPDSGSAAAGGGSAKGFSTHSRTVVRVFR